jgi:hypothetical protein
MDVVCCIVHLSCWEAALSDRAAISETLFQAAVLKDAVFQPVFQVTPFLQNSFVKHKGMEALAERHLKSLDQFLKFYSAPGQECAVQNLTIDGHVTL